MASECAHADVAERRRVWVNHRQPRMRRHPGRLVFIDETSVNTNMTRLRGRAKRGKRLKASAPFGKWGTQTFIAGLRNDGLTAPWVMLNRYGIGDRVSAEDAADLSALLERHDELEEKAGAGVAGFEVNVPPDDVPPFSKRCSWVVRTDGTKIDFSIGHCLKPKPDD